jgi:hypothetical protein
VVHGLLRTLPTELKVNHISDLDIDDSQESLISLYHQLGHAEAKQQTEADLSLEFPLIKDLNRDN